jgi:hypothetical protein
LPGASQQAARERDAEGLVAGQRFEIRAVNRDTSAELPAPSAPGIHTTLERIPHQ